MAEYALECTNLTHRYGGQAALSGVNLRLPAGKIYGLLGRNGAGKTTLLNIIAAGIFPTSGAALVHGRTTHEHAATLTRLCVIREKGMFVPGMRLRDVLSTCRKVYPNWDEAYARQLIKLFELNPKKRYKQLSRGMESSLGLVIGLASRADLTIFDEPSLGLDAVARENFYDQLIHDIEAHPRTVIISTHLIDEVSRLFEDVIILHRGEVLAYEPLDALLNSAVTLTGAEAAVDAAASGHKILRRDQLGGVSSVSLLRGEEDDFDGVAVEPLPLQKLFVYLTEGGASA